MNQLLEEKISATMKVMGEAIFGISQEWAAELGVCINCKCSVAELEGDSLTSEGYLRYGFCPTCNDDEEEETP